jgi:hypothetical protein
MSLNWEETHHAHTLAKYFEINRAKRAVLLLQKRNTDRHEVKIEERMLTKVRNAVKTRRFYKEDSRTPAERKAAREKQNLEEFIEKYPGLEDEIIKDMNQFDADYEGQMVSILKNPDMSFCNFIISLMMFLISLITFYSHRDFNTEYFNRQLIYKKLVDNPLGLQNYGNIKSVEDFKFFMNETIAI